MTCAGNYHAGSSSHGRPCGVADCCAVCAEFSHVQDCGVRARPDWCCPLQYWLAPVPQRLSGHCGTARVRAARGSVVNRVVGVAHCGDSLDEPDAGRILEMDKLIADRLEVRTRRREKTAADVHLLHRALRLATRARSSRPSMKCCGRRA
jgi:hypothetical protein